jgi:hypothetical protein
MNWKKASLNKLFYLHVSYLGRSVAWHPQCVCSCSCVVCWEKSKPQKLCGTLCFMGTNQSQERSSSQRTATRVPYKKSHWISARRPWIPQPQVCTTLNHGWIVQGHGKATPHGCTSAIDITFYHLELDINTNSTHSLSKPKHHTAVVICCMEFRPIFQMCRNSQQQPNKSQKQFPIKSPIKFTK